MIEPWLKAHLTNMGYWNEDGISRKACFRYCQKCRKITLVGLDRDFMALPTRVNVESLDPLEIVVSLLAGKSLCWLRKTIGKTIYIERFDSMFDDPKDKTVVLEHYC